MKTDLTVNGFIIHEDKVLLIHHKKLDMWLQPGGHIDADESPDEALHREIKEETGLKVDILDLSTLPISGNTKKNLAKPFHVNLHSVGDHDHVGFYYVCKVLNPEELKINEEVKDFKWFNKEELNSEEINEDIRNLSITAFERFNELQ